MLQYALNCISDPVVRDGEGRDRRAVPGDDGSADGAAEAPDIGEQAAAGDGREGTGEAAAGEDAEEGRRGRQGGEGGCGGSGRGERYRQRGAFDREAAARHPSKSQARHATKSFTIIFWFSRCA